MTPTEKKFQKKVLREYFDNHISEPKAFKNVVKFATKYELGYTFIETIKDDYENDLPF